MTLYAVFLLAMAMNEVPEDSNFGFADVTAQPLNTSR
jgi:hypothetical protein